MKRTITFILILTLCLTACGAKPSPKTQPEQAISTVSKEHCFLCGGGAKDLPYWGQNNVGIISLSTFEVMPIAINRYDEQGTLIEENINRITTHGFQAQENGFCAYAFETPDRGHASVSMTLNNDSIPDAEKMATFLCQNCLDATLSELSSPGFGVGVLNFATGELCVLEEQITGFYLSDYYVNFTRNSQSRADAELSIFYCPLRYPEDA